jgi:hypothetical protein
LFDPSGVVSIPEEPGTRASTEAGPGNNYGPNRPKYPFQDLTKSLTFADG